MIGKFHLLLLHLPIGILLAAVVLEWANHFKWQSINKEIFTLIYGIGALSAILASVTGYVLSLGYNYTGGETDNHFWAGMVTASLSILIFIVSIRGYQSQKWFSLLLAVSIGVTGHLGGSLTHGEGFLFPDEAMVAANPIPVFNIDEIENAQVYEDVITPLLKAKCISCHGASKIKGKLRMDSPEALMAGGKSGRDLLGDKSELLRRVHLPISNDKHMPPREKSQLSENEIAIIEWWIKKGAPFDASVEELPGAEETIPMIQKVIEASKSRHSDEANIPAFLPDIDLPAPDAEVLNQLRELKVVVLQAGIESPFLEVNFINVSAPEEKHWTLINQIKSNITWLKLSNVQLKPEDFIRIADMPNLVKLHLDGTSLDDEGFQKLQSLRRLRYLNINDTKVSDKGLPAIDSLTQLEQLYAFQTNISTDTLVNGAAVIKGGFTLPALATDSIRLD